MVRKSATQQHRKPVIRMQDMKAQRAAEGVIVPAEKRTELALAGGSVDTYLAGRASTRGTWVKFDKSGRYLRTKDDTEISKGTRAAVAYPQIQVGHMKFQGRGQPP